MIEAEFVESEFNVYGDDEPPLVVKQLRLSIYDAVVYLDVDEVHSLQLILEEALLNQDDVTTPEEGNK